MQPTAALILTHEENGIVKLPHVGWLEESNPGLETHIIVGPDSPLGKWDNWKNGDRPLRDWWRRNRDVVDGKVIAVMEWDTLVSCPLPHLPDTLDLAGAIKFVSPVDARRQAGRMMRSRDWTPDKWCWWRELDRLGLPPGSRAVGLVSFGFYVMRRRVLDSVCAERWDDVYARSVQNELRFPTAASISGHPVGVIPLPFVHFDAVVVTTRRGVYHSVKTPYDGKFEDG